MVLPLLTELCASAVVASSATALAKRGSLSPQRHYMFLNHVRAAELSQGCSSNAEAAVLLDAPRIRMAMEQDALPSTINWMTFIAQPPSPSWYQHRTASDADHLSVSCSHVLSGAGRERDT